MNELFDKEVNVQKENLKLKNTSGFYGSSCKPTKKCAMKMKVETRKTRWAPKIFCGEEGVYRAHVESS